MESKITRSIIFIAKIEEQASCKMGWASSAQQPDQAILPPSPLLACIEAAMCYLPGHNVSGCIHGFHTCHRL